MNKVIYVAIAVVIAVVAAVVLFTFRPPTAPPITTSTAQTSSATAASSQPAQPTASNTSSQPIIAMPECVELTYPDQTPTYVDNFRYVMQINMWNLKSANGTATLRYCNGTFYYRQELRDIVEKSPSAWVAGWPEIWIGYKPWNQPSTVGSPFPIQISNLLNSTMEVSVNYSVDIAPGNPLDLAFDIWVLKSPQEVASTSGPGPGDQEIMIWLYHQDTIPAGSQIGEVQIPIALNGTSVNATFSVWRYEPAPGGFIQWEYIAFVLADNPKSASIRFNLADFVRAAAKFTQISNYKDLWMVDLEIGSEFGNPYVTNETYSWILQLSINKK